MSAVEPAVGELERARAFIGICRWSYAKTVPEHPHEYCLRTWLSPLQRVEFGWFADLIAHHGYTGRFWGQSWRYLDVGDHKYWKSRTINGSGAIVNRARMEPVADAARRQPTQLSPEAQR
jgi:hypothetical protein